jgi:hypothetical protein
MGRKDIFLKESILLKEKRRPSGRLWPERRKDPASIGKHLDLFGNLRGRNPRLKAPNDRSFNVCIGREDMGF